MPTALLALLAFGGVWLAKEAKADDIGGYGRNGVIEQLTEKFNLNQDEVDEAVNQFREKRQAEMRAQHEERLQQAVDDGVITSEQKQALENRHNEMRETKTRMREEMQTWMEESGIDFEALRQYGGGCKGFGHGFKPEM
jgi:hypothetical protein